MIIRHSASEDGRVHTLEITKRNGLFGKILVFGPGEHSLGRAEGQPRLICIEGVFRYKGVPCYKDEGVAAHLHKTSKKPEEGARSPGGFISDAAALRACEEEERSRHIGHVVIGNGEDILVTSEAITICLLVDCE